MALFIKNWSTQVKKGYLELCVLSFIQTHGKLYGFQLAKLFEEHGFPIKEGTLYPLLNRMSNDKVLKTIWETKNIKGHPRKFYSLSKTGEKLFEAMKAEFEQMYQRYKTINTPGGNDGKSKIRKLSY